MRTILLILSLFSSAYVWAQKSGSHEFSLGLGVNFPVESSPLNVTGEQKMSSGLIGNGAYRVYLTELVAVGVRGSITSKKLNDYMIIKNPASTPEEVNFSVTTLHAGLESQVYFSSRGHVRPYLSLQLLYCENSLTSGNYGSLKSQGFLAGGGLGIRMKISEKILLSAEGIGLFGSAEWEQKPFNNSSGVEFNPASYRALFNIIFLIT